MKHACTWAVLGLVGAIAACANARREKSTPALDVDAVGAMVQRAPALGATARDVFAKSNFQLGIDGLRRHHPTSPISELVVHAPASSDGAFRMASGGVWRIGADLTLLDAASRPAELRDGRVVYRDVLPATDLLAAANATRLEHFLVLRDESAPHRFRWRLAPGKALTAQVEGDGVELVDARGESQVSLLPIVAVDQTGARVAAHSSFDDGVLTVDLPADLRYPVIVDPALEIGVWVGRTDVNPQPFSQYALTLAGWDPVNKGIFVSGDNGTANEAVFWNPALPSPQWATLASTGLVITEETFDPGFHNGVIYNPQVGALVAVSTRTPSTSSGNAFTSGLYKWTGTSWVLVPTGNFPPNQRQKFALAYDTSRSVMVMCGGLEWSSFSHGLFVEEPNETWQFDGTNWTAITGAGGDASDYPGMVYDSIREKLVLLTFNGSANNTYEFEAGKWALKAPAHPPPIPVYPAEQDLPMDMVFDPLRGRTVLQYGNSTYEWDGTDWTLMGTGGPGPGALFYDSVRRRIYSAQPDFPSIYEYHRRGAACTTGATCDTNNCVDGVCCETSSCGGCQTCGGDTPGTCGPVASAEHDTCTGDRQCYAGVCQTKQGKACTANGDCHSTFCVDKVCCDTACTDTCKACAAAVKQSNADDGTCDYALAGQNPHSDCTAQTSPVCGFDGTCNGSGLCRQQIPGTACGEKPSCLGGSAQGQLCDGVGDCKPLTVACSPGLCVSASGSCSLTCASDTDCDPEQGYCNTSICVTRLSNGAACTRDAQCTGRACIDGVCCNSRCTGECEACDVEGSVGSCVPVLGLPHAARPACPTLATTGDACAVGACDGDTRTSCAGFPGPEVACRAASCTNSVATLAAGCSSKGACADVQTKPCTPYGCTGDACATSCASDADCAPDATCALATKTCVTGTTCDGNHILKSQAGDQDCAPYTCEGSSCKKSCASVDDCVAPTECNPNGQCVAPSTGSSASGCATQPSSSSRGSLSALVGLGLALAALRRRLSGKAAASTAS